ncbi:MAG: hypothetical protein AAFV59_09560 [Pseudomonadota bacterium]
MGRVFLLLLIVMFGQVSVQAQQDDCAKIEAACVLDAAWSAALLLPTEKQRRLGPAFLEIAQLSGDPDLLSYWQSRFGQDLTLPISYPDYGWQKAEPILRSRGIDGLIEAAERRDRPLNTGRSDVLLSAGKRLADEDQTNALKLNHALLALSQSASKFERPVLAHAAAELAMVRCDSELLADAIASTDAPQSLRYAFWKARISGDRKGLLSRVRAIENDSDTRDVRRVLDGYRAILELGYCETETKAIGG